MHKQENNLIKQCIEHTLITYKVVKNVEVDVIKQIFEHLSKHSRTQEQFRHVYYSKSGTKVFLK